MRRLEGRVANVLRLRRWERVRLARVDTGRSPRGGLVNITLMR